MRFRVIGAANRGIREIMGNRLSYPPDPRLAFHPYWPERLKFRTALRLANKAAANAIALGDGLSLQIDRNRTTLYREASRVLSLGLPGDFAEIGVHRGGSAAVIASAIRETDRHLHLFDRWGDLPEPTPADGAVGARYARADISEKLATLGDTLPLTRHAVEERARFPADQVHYHQGWYDESLGAYAGGPLAFVSLDCDYYESVKLALAFLTEHAADDCTVVLDDYRDWPGVKAALNDWLPTAPFVATLSPLNLGTAILRLRRRGA